MYILYLQVPKGGVQYKCELVTLFLQYSIKFLATLVTVNKQASYLTKTVFYLFLVSYLFFNVSYLFLV